MQGSVREDRARSLVVVTLLAFVLGAVALVARSQAAATPDTLGKTTIDQRVVPTASPGFRALGLGPGEPYTVREGVGATAQAGREQRRRSLLYFGQLSDFQLADEESPARVEVVDLAGGPVSAAWRPWEALQPQIDDAAIRQMNTFAAASPVVAGNASRRPMDFVLDTGDSADNQQLNETQWVRTLLDGGPLDPNSGIALPANYVGVGCVPGAVPDAAEAAKYTGVQDYNDYQEGVHPAFYDPNDPRGSFADFPAYPNLMDRAQHSFSAAGLSVPSYVVFGNHDALAQGNQAANGGFEQVGTGCLKPAGLLPAMNPGDLPSALASLTPTALTDAAASDPSKVMTVPPDPNRQYVSKEQYKNVFKASSQADGHGFDYIDAAEETASNGAAGYYSWHPRPGVRFIGLDTVSEGGITGPSAEGNIDDPQYQWLQAQLTAAKTADEIVVLFGHHAIPSLTSQVPDEAAPPCSGENPSFGHDVNPGCDVDPRNSQPVHLGADLESLVHQYPNVVAWVSGHSHVNDVTPYPDGNGGGFWSIRTAAEADWPQQERLIEIMENRDGTLSIFGTILDHASNATAPAGGTDTTGLGEADLASIGRTLSYNDDQLGARACDPACGEGTTEDRNVELLVKDPRPIPPDRDGDGFPDATDSCPDQAAPGSSNGCPAAKTTSLSVDPDRVRTGKTYSLRFRLRSSSAGCIGGATIVIGPNRARTDSGGRATIRRDFTKPGTKTAKATKSGCPAASTTIKVRS